MGFTEDIIIGASRNNYYYGPYGWHGGAMYNEAWEDRYEYRENRQENSQENAPQRQANQAQRHSSMQDRPGQLWANQGQRQTSAAPAQSKTGSEWRFDGEAAKEEILTRRIRRNELNVIGICHACAGAQRENAGESHDGKRQGLFAQRLRSTAGRQDGPYWPRIPGQRRSPLGDLASEAAAEGYNENRPSSTPLWGYHFRVLTAQGDAAPGGRRSYIENGDMSGGFALLAFPAKYASPSRAGH